MRIAANTLPTQHGYRLANEPEPPRLRSAADRAAVVHRLDTDADAAMAAGDVRLADLLAWRAAGLREAVS